MLFPPPIRDVLVQETRFPEPDLTPACGIDRELHRSQNAQRQALGDNGMQRFEYLVRRPQFTDLNSRSRLAPLKVGKTSDRFVVDQ